MMKEPIPPDKRGRLGALPGVVPTRREALNHCSAIGVGAHVTEGAPERMHPAPLVRHLGDGEPERLHSPVCSSLMAYATPSRPRSERSRETRTQLARLSLAPLQAPRPSTVTDDRDLCGLAASSSRSRASSGACNSIAVLGLSLTAQQVLKHRMGTLQSAAGTAAIRHGLATGSPQLRLYCVVQLRFGSSIENVL